MLVHGRRVVLDETLYHRYRNGLERRELQFAAFPVFTIELPGVLIGA
jgi:hypothetical protein